MREGKYAFKPKYHLKDKKALLRLLDKHDQLGLGGVLLDDVEEGLPNAAKAIKVKALMSLVEKKLVDIFFDRSTETSKHLETSLNRHFVIYIFFKIFKFLFCFST